MSDKLKSVLIGLFVVTAVFSIIYVILFMEPKIGDGAKTLKVKFSNISGINIGTRVTLAGKPIGEVEGIKTIKDVRDEKADKMGRIFYYELILKVDSSVNVYNTDEITIATTGLLGEKSIAIIPKAPKKGQIIKNIDDKIIYAQALEPLEKIMHHMISLTDKMETAIDNFDKWFLENQEDLSNFVENFSNAMKSFDTLVDSANKEQMVKVFKKATELFSDNMQLLKISLEEVHDQEMLAKLDVILDNLADASTYLSTDGTQILENVNKITTDIAEGKGSLGRFITNDDFYIRVTAILSKIDTLMNDINHYGILFQYDKHWQRIRKKKACIMENMQTPKEFQNYFDKEMDNITTSLSRISTVINKSKDKDACVLKSKDFKKGFILLLKQVEHFLDSLKLYNENLSDKPECEDNIKKCS